MRGTQYIRPAATTIYGPRAPAMRVSVMRGAMRNRTAMERVHAHSFLSIPFYDGVFYWRFSPGSKGPA